MFPPRPSALTLIFIILHIYNTSLKRKKFERRSQEAGLHSDKSEKKDDRTKKKGDDDGSLLKIRR